MRTFEKLSINTGTMKKASLAEALEVTAAAGLSHIGLWRDKVAEVGLEHALKMVRESGLQVSSLCRGGFLTAADEQGQAAALADNKAAILEAEALGAPEIIMVVGGLPDFSVAPGAVDGGGATGSIAGGKDVVSARERVGERLGELVPFAIEHGVRLALEPLHPMFAADRAVLSTLGQALDLAAPYPAEAVGVVIDTFHVWWDPSLQEQIARAGQEGRIASYQVCDFNLPIASDSLLSRGFMGDGVIDFPTIGRWVAEAGYSGVIEVEIFNEEIWAQPHAEVVECVKDRYRELVAPYANDDEDVSIL
ncbi:sugar phosphate isomerase/epimerase family protein [Arthrobacter antibioticus]|uniref:sugar phosphate isomerase/epimerase family protein n=1 Tax=Arthrobacter sp. H35-MC1 TaxID=3046203 RepID=UPI0024BB2C62|nr:sugar phosphate isomerase/epimerase family protein [Arthrobacter sp. H35-MC1]MDJ0315646.1 sugar phosphate isomerase/epimerase family protein [Arthrobacter sp. H35-MC1]